MLKFDEKYGIKSFKKVLSVVDVLATLRSGNRIIKITDDTLVTSLAKETARKHNITLIKKGEEMRRKIIAGNWKMHKTLKEAVDLAGNLKERASQFPSDREVVICPPFTALSVVGEVIKGSPVKLGAQNTFWEEKGAYTGEVSPPMLKDAGCQYVIIGHSERRQYFGETNYSVNKKMKKVLESGLTPIVCVGEKLQEREDGKTLSIIEEQVREGMEGLSTEEASGLVVAYEPVWAIGTGKTATPQQAEEVHDFIRKKIRELYGEEVANNLPILYGGSIKPQNIASLMECANIDGGLVGGASLELESFSQIINY